MKPPVAVIDTNVVVEGLLTKDATSPVAVILEGMLNGRFRFLLSVELLAEYRRVLLRPAIRALHALGPSEVDAILEEIAAAGIFREPAVAPAEDLPDPTDRHLWQLLATWPGAVLVTGDKALLGKPPAFAGVLAPSGFHRLLEKDQRQ
ncbi:MAG: PIN domain-containing protein [Armatimonadota bacterium]|nr:PIN domain-containing protein [Armatimonadota bacterium]